MSVICRSFSENAWKKDLCSNCFRSEIEHCFDGAVKKAPATFDELKVNLSSSFKSQLRKDEKIENSKRDSTGIWSSKIGLSNGGSNENGVNGESELSIKNRKNFLHLSISADDRDPVIAIPAVESPTTQPTRLTGILKTASQRENKGGKNLTVQFNGDPIVIGYCADEYDSGNDEEHEDEDERRGTPSSESELTSDDEQDLGLVTKANTSFNSSEQNLEEDRVKVTIVEQAANEEDEKRSSSDENRLPEEAAIELADAENSSDCCDSKVRNEISWLSAEEYVNKEKGVQPEAEEMPLTSRNQEKPSGATHDQELMDVSPTAIYRPGGDLFVRKCSSSDGSSTDSSSEDVPSKPTSLITGYYDNLQAGFCNGMQNSGKSSSSSPSSSSSSPPPPPPSVEDGGQRGSELNLKLDWRKDEDEKLAEDAGCISDEDEEKLSPSEEGPGYPDSETQSESSHDGGANCSEIYSDGKSCENDKEVPTKPARLPKSVKPVVPTKPSQLCARSSPKIECPTDASNVYQEIGESTRKIGDEEKCASEADPAVSKREQRLAELAVELEQVRNNSKRAAPLPPPSDGSDRGNRVKTNAPPRPPPPNLSSGRFSFKKFLKLTKDSHEADTAHDRSSSNLKAWKRATDFDRSKIQIIHPLEISGLENTEATYESIPELTSADALCGSRKSKSYSLAPKPPSRKNRSLEALNETKPSKASTSSFYVHLHPLPHPHHPPPPPPPPPPLPSSPPPSSSSSSSQSLLLSSLSSSMTPTDTPNASPPLTLRSVPLTYEVLTLEDVYSAIAKLNFDSINQILRREYSRDLIRKTPLGDYQFGSCEAVNGSCQLYRQSTCNLDKKAANLLVTPESYSVNVDTCPDIIFGNCRMNENNLFIFGESVDTFITMEKLVLGRNLTLPFALGLKHVTFLLIQFITLLKSYQGNGMEEITEEQLQSMVVCLSSRREDHICIVNQKPESIVKNECMSLIPQYTLCQCAGSLLRNLNSLGKHWLLQKIERIFEEEKAQSLSLAKNMCEALLFDVPLNLRTAESLKYYLDLKRAEAAVSAASSSEGGHTGRSLINYCYLMFLNKSNRKTLYDGICRLQDA